MQLVPFRLLDEAGPQICVPTASQLRYRSWVVAVRAAIMLSRLEFVRFTVFLAMLDFGSRLETEGLSSCVVIVESRAVPGERDEHDGEENATDHRCCKHMHNIAELIVLWCPPWDESPGTGPQRHPNLLSAGARQQRSPASYIQGQGSGR